MAVSRKSPKATSKKSPSKAIPGTIRKITPLRKTKTPTSKSAFRSTRKTTSTPKKGSNIFSRSVIAKTSSTRTTARSSKTPLTLGARTTPGRTTPGRTTPGRTTPGRTTPGRTTPGRTRRASPKSLTALKPKSPARKATSSVAAKLTPDNQFLYISLSICSGLILFVLILFCFYKLYEYFNPSEKSTTDSIDFMEELEDLETKDEVAEENQEQEQEEEKIIEEANDDQ